MLAASPSMKKQFRVKTGTRMYEIQRHPDIKLFNPKISYFLEMSMAITPILHKYRHFIIVYMRTFIRYTEPKRGTRVRMMLVKSVRYGDLLDMMYVAKDGQVSSRRIKVLQVGENSFRAYCYLRKTNRTFTIDNVLALVPI